MNLTSVQHISLQSPFTAILAKDGASHHRLLADGTNAQEVEGLAQGLEAEPGLTVGSPGPKSHAPFSAP